ncbi:hypothetical protein E2C01_036613 [Portunus trituberculatus]|uniref:Uncharacterized protein n=1 Tax=Portunus trituberculatus TaxID=210409 RepID=A0A5B7FCY5_PORTR|nr:hypothetical protein [Portunus trituberculatus]
MSWTTKLYNGSSALTKNAQVGSKDTLSQDGTRKRFVWVEAKCYSSRRQISYVVGLRRDGVFEGSGISRVNQAPVSLCGMVTEA